MDSEKVIKGMKMCISPNECSPDDCPYYIRPNNESGLCWDRLMTDALALLKEQEADTSKYQYKYDHTDCIWYHSDEESRCPSTCSQYRDGWNDAMDYIFKDGKGYQPYIRKEGR